MLSCILESSPKKMEEEINTCSIANYNFLQSISKINNETSTVNLKNISANPLPEAPRLDQVQNIHLCLLVSSDNEITR